MAMRPAGPMSCAPLIIIVHVGKKSTYQNNGPYGTDPQRMCRRVVIKFVADGIDKI